MRDFDSAVLHAGTQLSAFSGHLLGLLERLTQRLALEHAETSANSNVSRMARADLLSALELQKQVIEEHSALVRSMLQRQGLEPHLTAVQSTDIDVHRAKRLSPQLSGLAESGPVRARRRGGLVGRSFTQRQRELIELVALGYDNRQIAQSLSIAEQTVKNHLHTIFEKAGVSRRRDLADLAVRANNTNHVADTKSHLAENLPRQREAL
jgi:ATP/maltotriose-dependent transcriptional regulator MalT